MPLNFFSISYKLTFFFLMFCCLTMLLINISLPKTSLTFFKSIILLLIIFR